MFFDFSLGGHLPEGGIFCISKSMSESFFRLSPGLLSFRRCKGSAQKKHPDAVQRNANGMLTNC